MERECSTNGTKRNAYGLMMGKPQGKRPVRREREIIIISGRILEK
jgi:hypothetical protein